MRYYLLLFDYFQSNLKTDIQESIRACALTCTKFNTQLLNLSTSCTKRITYTYTTSYIYLYMVIKESQSEQDGRPGDFGFLLYDAYISFIIVNEF